MKEHGLLLAPEKTETIMLTNDWDYFPPAVNLNGHVVTVNDH